MSKEPISVSMLNLYIKNLLEDDMELGNVTVKGEISNFKHHSSGHMYFSLKDEGSKLKCIMFRGANMFLKFKPEDGMNVIIDGYISLYERDGQYQLYCNKMEPDGIGGLYLAYEQLKEKLQKEGLFDKNIKMPIPEFPLRIGVATSSTGAVIRDIINVSTKRFKGANILLYPVKVQGEGAALSIVEAIKYFNSRDDIDLIIIGRGGGSIEELWAFNEEILARAIHKSSIPVISAVGHETDFTIADFVSDARASTPSHAAEMAVPSYENLLFKIKKLQEMLTSHTLNNINRESLNIRNIMQSIKGNSPERNINQHAQYIDNIENRLTSLIKNNSLKNKTDVSLLTGKLDSLSPLKVLKRGYSFTEKDGCIVKSIKKLKYNDIIKINIYDGSIECKVINIMEGHEWRIKEKN